MKITEAARKHAAEQGVGEEEAKREIEQGFRKFQEKGALHEGVKSYAFLLPSV